MVENNKPIEIEFSKTPEPSLKSKFATVDSTLFSEETKQDDPITSKLQKQMEFYFGDSNLHNDRFLLNLLQQNEKGFIDLTIFLNFNKVKKILADIYPLDQKLSTMQEAIRASNLLKLNKEQTKVRRKVAFNPYSNKNDKRVVYVENFPEKATHEILAKIFAKCGEVLHVSIPKYSETHTAKGFAFIEFKTEEAVSTAFEKYNNCIPAEFLNEDTKGKVQPLKVIPKAKWLEMKQEFKSLKQKLLDLAGVSGDPQQNEKKNHLENSEEGGFVEKKIDRKDGCLVKLGNLQKETTKQDIFVALKHFCNPAFVDFKRGSETCVVRFDNKTLREAFCERCQVYPMKILKSVVTVEKVEGAEENSYWEEINKKKNAFRHYLYNKKHQNLEKRQKKI